MMRSLMANAMVTIAALIVLSWALIGWMLWQAHAEAIQSAGAAGQHMARVLAEYESSSLRAVDLTLRYLRDDWLRDPGALDASVARHQEHLQRDVLQSGGDVVTLARADRTSLARTRDLDRATKLSLKDTPGLRASDAQAGVFMGSGRIDGVTRLVAYSKVRSYPLAVYVSQEMD